MLLDAKNDLFEFEFPKTFFPEEIVERWDPYIKRFPTPIQTTKDFLNTTIQGVTTSALSYDPSEQQGTVRRAERKWRSSQPVSKTAEKTITVTFKLVDGYANYFMIMELFDYWYSFFTEENYCPPMTLFTVDGDGNRLLQFELLDLLMTSVSELTLNYSDNVQQFNTFDVQFDFNRYQIKFPFD